MVATWTTASDGWVSERVSFSGVSSTISFNDVSPEPHEDTNQEWLDKRVNEICNYWK